MAAIDPERTFARMKALLGLGSESDAKILKCARTHRTTSSDDEVELPKIPFVTVTVRKNSVFLEGRHKPEDRIMLTFFHIVFAEAALYVMLAYIAATAALTEHRAGRTDLCRKHYLAAIAHTLLAVIHLI